MIGRRGLLAAPFLLAGAPAPLAAIPLSRDLAWWRARHEAKLRERAARPIRLVFLGDSITQRWEDEAYRPAWQQFYGDRDALNLGFVGDATSHLLWRIEHGEVDGISPRAAVVLIGANNFGHLHWPAGDTLLGIEAILAALRRRLPSTKIILLGVLPSDRGPWVAENTRTLNAALGSRHGQGGDVAYVDLGGVLTKGGRIDLSLFADPAMQPPRPALHPSPAGQAALAAALEPTMAAVMRDQDHR